MRNEKKELQNIHYLYGTKAVMRTYGWTYSPKLFCSRIFQIGIQAIAVLLTCVVLSSCSKEKEKETETEKSPVKISTTGIVPVDIPTTGFDYPGDRSQIQAWADTWQIDKITEHSWNIWAGMTTGSGQTYEGAELPVWETWCGTIDVFYKICEKKTKPPRDFIQATQLSHNSEKANKSELRLVAFNKYNPAMANFMAINHPGPKDLKYDYTERQGLASLNAAWPKGTPIADRKIQDTPYSPGKATAIEIKPVMYVVKARQITTVPLWLGPMESTVAKTPIAGNDCTGVVNSSSPNAAKCHPDPATWLTCVILDPNSAASIPNPIPATEAQIKAAEKGATPKCSTFLYASLDTIYHTKMDGSEASDFNNVQAGSGVKAEAGDFAVLTAMHINTKTIVNWTWQTMWWQPGDDTVNKFPGSKQGMTSNVKSYWRNYAMCTAYNQTEGKSSEIIQVCFNPFLETSSQIPDGLQSNCMSCHGTATAGKMVNGNVSTLHYPKNYTKSIDFNNDPMFKDFTRTDFSWAIPSNSLGPSVAATLRNKHKQTR